MSEFPDLLRVGESLLLHGVETIRDRASVAVSRAERLDDLLDLSFDDVDSLIVDGDIGETIDGGLDPVRDPTDPSPYREDQDSTDDSESREDRTDKNNFVQRSGLPCVGDEVEGGEHYSIVWATVAGVTRLLSVAPY